MNSKLQILITVVSRAIGAASALLLTLFISKLMTTDGAGVFFLLYTWLHVLGVVCSLGLSVGFVRSLAAIDGDAASRLYLRLFRMIFELPVATAFLVAFFFFFFSDSLSQNIFPKGATSAGIGWAVASLPFHVTTMLIGYSFQGIRRANISTLVCHSLTPAVFIICTSLASPSDPTVYVMSKLLFISNVASSVISVILYCVLSDFSSGWGDADDWPVVKSALLSELPSLWISSLMLICLQWSSQVIGGIFLTPQELAILYVYLRLALSVSLVLVAVNIYASPRYSKFHASGDLLALKNLVRQCGQIMVVVAVPILFALFVFADFFLTIFGEEYSADANLFRLLLLAQFFNVTSGSSGVLLNMTGFANVMRDITLLSGVAAILLALFLTLFYGLYGAILAGALAVILQNALAAYCVYRYHKINMFKIF